MKMQSYDFTCPICHTSHSVSIVPDDFNAFWRGMLLENAAPYLTPTERKAVMAGICPNCQKGAS